MRIITGKENKKMKHIRLLLQKSSYRKKQKQYTVEGLKMVNEALSLGLVEEVYLMDSLYQNVMDSIDVDKEELEKLKDYLKTKKNLFYRVNDSIFHTISDTVTPQGILAIVKKKEYLLEELLQREEIRLVVLDEIQDPGNLGTILRTAEAAGMNALIMSDQTADVYNPKVVRSTMGSIFRLPFLSVENLEETIQELKTYGIQFFAAHLKAKQNFRSIEYPKKSAVLIGNEAKGLRNEIAALADSYIFIPMEGKVESLNAAIAAALIMYEMKYGN